tara:strand:+ start:2389 stop:2853 length:465 start_codon:yes stop_codon:yes gene_type:complete
MAISQAVCNVFKQELLKGNHDFDGGATYYIALYTSSANLGATTTAYATNPGGGANTEVTNSSGAAYSAGGQALTGASVTGGSGTATAFVDFNDVSWTSASFTANGALIYRQDGSAPTNDAVVVLAFGGNFTASNGTFTIQFPANGGGSEIIRLG